MVEADHSISRHTPLTIAQRQRMAIMTLAMQAARGVVKNELKRQGRRLADDGRQIAGRVSNRGVLSFLLVQSWSRHD